MDSCLISLIVPVYNVEKYIKKCLSSLIHQTYSNIEIICINDCSTDASGKICDEFADKDHRILVIHKKRNEGLSEARNSGLQVSKGEYIAFVDSDDWVEFSYIEKLYTVICDSKADIAQCAYARIANDTVALQKKTQISRAKIMSGDQAVKMLFSEGIIQPSVEYTVVWNKLFRKDIVKNIKFPKGVIFEDQFFTYRCFDNAKRVCVVKEILYYYRDNSSSITKQEYNIKFQDEIKAHQEQIKYFLSKNYDQTVQLIVARIVPLCISHYLRACFFELKYEEKMAYKYVLNNYRKYLMNKFIPVEYKIKVLVFLVWPDMFFYFKWNVNFYWEEKNGELRATDRK